MGESRFDEFSKALAGASSRRSFLKVVGGGIATAMLGGLGLAPAPGAEADCTSNCAGINNPHCQHDCIGPNNPQCKYNCTGQNNPQCEHTCAGRNNPRCTTNCAGANIPRCQTHCSHALPQCASGQTVCGTYCADTPTDTQNCGACGNVCPTATNATTTCSSGVCSVTCPNALTAYSLPCSATVRGHCEQTVANAMAAQLVVCKTVCQDPQSDACLQCVQPFAAASAGR
jgi:hypothetical protein